MSLTTTDGCERSKISIASRTDAAVATSAPQYSRMKARTSRESGSSSTRSTRTPFRFTLGPPLDYAIYYVTGGMSEVYVVTALVRNNQAMGKPFPTLVYNRDG